MSVDLETHVVGEVPAPMMQLQWEQSFVSELPGDASDRTDSRQVVGAAYSRVKPTPVAAPRIVAWEPRVADALGLDGGSEDDPGLAAWLAGNLAIPGMAPYAACYGGHQFGHWAGQLGDGRAITLGEVRGPEQRWELQLKGAGKTPYSRGADGRAVLRSSLREFLCSEAMHALGVPTTRALSLVTSGESVVRDMFYDGHPRPEPGAIVCRVAPSFLRFGSYQLPASRNDLQLLGGLLDYTLRHHFPKLGQGRDGYVAVYEEVCTRSAILVAEWMRVGFVHGVLNTDNMSMLGLTIDYGPYGWVDSVDPAFTPNTTDAHGRRYAFGRQPDVVAWNLARLGEALLPVVGAVAPLQAALERYGATFRERHRCVQLSKLGLTPGTYVSEDEVLLIELASAMQAVETDMTILYRRLAQWDPPCSAGVPDEVVVASLMPAFYVDTPRLPRPAEQQWARWLRDYGARLHMLGVTDEERRQRMSAVNPKYVLRNYLAQEAIEQLEAGDTTLLHTLQEVLRRPYVEQPEYERFAAKRPDWARNRPGCSMLSCSS